MEYDPLVERGDRLLYQVAKDEEANGLQAQKAQSESTFQKVVLFVVPCFLYLMPMGLMTYLFHDYMFPVIIIITAPFTFFGFIPFLDQPRWIKSLGVLSLLALCAGSITGFGIYVK